MPFAIGNFTRMSPDNPEILANRSAGADCATNPAQWHNSKRERGVCRERRAWCDDIIQAFKARDTLRVAFLVRRRISHTQEAILASFPDEAASR
jgi:hypothetical protein